MLSILGQSQGVSQDYVNAHNGGQSRSLKKWGYGENVVGLQQKNIFRYQEIV